MRITSPPPLPFPSALKAGQSTAAHMAHRQTEKADSSRKAETTEVFAHFDLTAISPREVDQLVHELKTKRFDDLGFVMSLEREGANYRAEVEAAATIPGYEGDGGFDPDAKLDLLAKTRADLDMARRYGEDTERLEQQLAKLETFVSPSSGHQTPSRLAETLLWFRAQG